MNEDKNMVGDLLDLGECVAGHQHRAALSGQSAQVRPQPPHPRRVESIRRFIEDEDVGVAEHRRGESQPLAHPQGEFADPSAGVVGEPGRGQDT